MHHAASASRLILMKYSFGGEGGGGVIGALPHAVSARSKPPNQLKTRLLLGRLALKPFAAAGAK